MNPTALIAVALLLSTGTYVYGRRRALRLAEGNVPGRLHSLPAYHGVYVALWSVLPALLCVAAWAALEPFAAKLFLLSRLGDGVAGLGEGERTLLVSNVVNYVAGDVTSSTLSPSEVAAADAYSRFLGLSRAAMQVVAVLLVAGGFFRGRRALSEDFRARSHVEAVLRVVMIVASGIAVLTTVGIVLSLVFESARFFAEVSPTDFFFGLKWSPQTALRADQVGASGAFGAIPLFAGTLLITVLAMCVAVPIGLFSAVYMSEYAGKGARAAVKPLLEVLAGVPTVVYGFFAALTVAPLLRDAGMRIGLDVASESALAAGLVMGVMIVPFVSSLSDDVINAVPQTLRDGAYALGATKSETIRQVVLPAALPGIVGAVLLAVSRAVGETMIVVMAAGLAANLTANPLEAVTTVTVQIVTLLVGDQEFDSAKTLAAFALGLTLFFITLALNVVALSVVRRYRERYD